VRYLDVTANFNLEREYDWALVLNAMLLLTQNAEKLSLQKRIFSFVRNLARHTSNGVFLCLSTSRHEQDQTSPLAIGEKLDAAMEKVGFVVDKASQAYAQSIVRNPWLKGGIRIYLKVDTGLKSEFVDV
jgi:hypothetical protein